jgi:hypothetical protein
MQPTGPVSGHDAPQGLPLLWLSTDVDTHFAAQAWRDVERRHEQLVGGLLAIGAAQVVARPLSVLERLDPWPNRGTADWMGFSGPEVFPSFAMKSLVTGIAFQVPPDLTPLEARRHPTDPLGGRGRFLRCMFSNNGEDARTTRTALGNLARAAIETDPGEAILRLAMCLEAVLLEAGDTDNVTARLVEATAHHLGGRRNDRNRRRRLVRRLYVARSNYVHTGEVAKPSEKCVSVSELREIREVVQGVLRRAMFDLAREPNSSLEDTAV